MGPQLVELWRAVITPSLRPNSGMALASWDASRPATHINWFSALAFANRLSAAESLSECYRLEACEGDVSLGAQKCQRAQLVGACEGWRLPTEAEWEFFARAGGDGPAAGWTVYDRVTAPQPVATRAPNALGIYDAIGNVLEWTWDSYDETLQGGSDPARNKAGGLRVLRGGAYKSFGPSVDPHQYRVSRRFAEAPHIRRGSNGLRLVRSAE
jgi:formylglycine-generating enzyme required for sulfatase activity